MTTLIPILHIYGAGCVIGDDCARFFARNTQRLLCIINDKFFAKGIYIVASTPSNLNFQRIERRKLYGIANHISPQPSRCRYNHRIVYTEFYICHRYGFRRVSKRLDRQELIEYSIVQHQQQISFCRFVLQRKESFRGIIRFDVLHIICRNELFVLFAIRLESHTTVHKQFHIRPHLEDIILTGVFQNSLQKNHIPRWRTRK